MTASQQWILCAGTIPRATFRERVESAAEAGFKSITLFPEHYLDAVERERLAPTDIDRCLQEAGIRVDQLDPLLDWFEDAATGSELRLFAAAEATGARSINLAPAFAPTHDRGFLTERLGAVAERAARRGLSLDLEFLPWSPIPNLDAASSIVRDCGLSNLGVMLDAWHFFRSGDSVQNLGAERLASVTGVQLNDSPRTPTALNLRARWDTGRALLGWAKNGWRTLGPRDFVRVTRKSAPSSQSNLVPETLTARLLPGDGEQPLAELCAALRTAGFTAPMGVEVFNSALHRLPPLEAARRAIEACRQATGIDPPIDSGG